MLNRRKRKCIIHFGKNSKESVFIGNGKKLLGLVDNVNIFNIVFTGHPTRYFNRLPIKNKRHQVKTCKD